MNRRKKKHFTELTCPLEREENKANAYKTIKYTPLELSLEEKGFKV